jgi:hypothetical protein
MEEQSQATPRHAKFAVRYGCHTDSPRNLLHKHIIMAVTVQFSVDRLSVDR